MLLLLLLREGVEFEEGNLSLGFFLNGDIMLFMFSDLSKEIHNFNIQIRRGNTKNQH